jgi:hypothetical protein
MHDLADRREYNFGHLKEGYIHSPGSPFYMPANILNGRDRLGIILHVLK